MFCDSQLQVWYFSRIEGVDHSVWNVVWFLAPGMIFLLDGGGWSFRWNVVWFFAQLLLFHLPKVKKFFSTFSFPLTESGKELVHFPHFTYRKWKKNFFTFPIPLTESGKVVKLFHFLLSTFTFPFYTSKDRGDWQIRLPLASKVEKFKKSLSALIVKYFTTTAYQRAVPMQQRRHLFFLNSWLLLVSCNFVGLWLETARTAMLLHRKEKTPTFHLRREYIQLRELLSLRSR